MAVVSGVGSLVSTGMVVSVDVVDVSEGSGSIVVVVVSDEVTVSNVGGVGNVVGALGPGPRLTSVVDGSVESVVSLTVVVVVSGVVDVGGAVVVVSDTGGFVAGTAVVVMTSAVVVDAAVVVEDRWLVAVVLDEPIDELAIDAAADSMAKSSPALSCPERACSAR